MNEIVLTISESIKTGKWLDISYKNKQGEITYYWIAIQDIDLKNKILICKIFNDHKSFDCLDAYIRVNNILSAQILDFTTYDVPEQLLNKLEKHKEDAKWLKYETFNNNILRYYKKCNELDNDPCQKESFLLEGIDKTILLKEKQIILNEDQARIIINYIKNYDESLLEQRINYLILSVLSIEENYKKYVVI